MLYSGLPDSNESTNRTIWIKNHLHHHLSISTVNTNVHTYVRMYVCIGKFLVYTYKMFLGYTVQLIKAMSQVLASCHRNHLLSIEWQSSLDSIL